MIHKLESAGLGYHVKSDESDDRFGMKLSTEYLLSRRRGKYSPIFTSPSANNC